MRRTLVLPCVLIAAMAVGMGSGAIAQAVSESIEGSMSDDSTDAAETDMAIAPPPAVEKQLHTIPEDGETTGAFDFVPKWLRALLDSRPNEDLIVCIAGCSPNRDRVVYARLKETPDPAPQAAAPPAPTANAPPAVAAPAADTAAPPVASAKPDAALADDAAKKDASESSFVPTFNLPLETDGAPAE
ncbi:MAG: hypothetical protein ACT4OU_13215 [Hyphomicrobium sp.]